LWQDEQWIKLEGKEREEAIKNNYVFILGRLGDMLNNEQKLL